MRSISVKIYIILALSLLFSGCGYNRLVRMEGNLQDSWLSLDALFDEREALSEDLVLLLDRHGFRNPLLTDQLDLCRKQVFSITVLLKEPETFDRYMSAQSDLAALLDRMIEESGKIPQIALDVSYKQMLSDWNVNNDHLMEQLVTFEENREDYNRYLDPWPRSFIAQWLGFQPYEDRTVEAKAVLLQLP